LGHWLAKIEGRRRKVFKDKTTEVQDRLEQKCQQFAALFAAKSINQMIEAFYAVDAVMEGAELTRQHGRDAIERAFSEARESCRSIEINLDPVTVVGDVAFGCITNINVMKDGGCQVHRGMTVWTKSDGDWFVQSDFFFTQREDLEIAGVLA
jgi:ketosteroid isomerase-like protein